jgi:hypothetical protein
MSGDARYDQERKLCACGYGYFVALTVGEVHVSQQHPFLTLLPGEDGGLAVLRVPMFECVQCRTRYDRLWREVV